MPRRPRPPSHETADIVDHASVQLSVEDPSAGRLGFAPTATIRVVLSTLRGTGRWMLDACLDGAHPLIDGRDGVVLSIHKVRYDEPRARKLYGKVLRAIELADISGLRRACLVRERDDVFFCWAFGLASLEDSLGGRRARARARRRR